MALHAAQRISLSHDIMVAVTIGEDRKRVEALRSVALRLHSDKSDELSGTSVRDEVLAVLRQQSMARAYQALRELSFIEPIGELNIMHYARDGKREMTICAIAQIAYLPVDVADRMFTAAAPDILLVICRAQNFAWSTLRSMLAMHRSAPLASEVEQELCDDYHAMPLALAQRFGRYLRAHFEV